MNKLNEKQLEYVNTAYEMFSTDTLEKSQIKQVNAKLGMKSSPAWLIKDPQFRLSRGVYKLPVSGIVNPSKNVFLLHFFSASDIPRISCDVKGFESPQSSFPETIELLIHFRLFIIVCFFTIKLPL